MYVAQVSGVKLLTCHVSLDYADWAFYWLETTLFLFCFFTYFNEKFFDQSPDCFIINGLIMNP